MCRGRSLYGIIYHTEGCPLFSPITWSLSTLVFLVFLLCTDWTRGFEKT